MMMRLKSFNVLECEIDLKFDNNKRKKIRERLKELSVMMTNWRIVNMDWIQKLDALVIVFNNGLISHIYFNCDNFVTRVYHDRYLVNKLLSEHVVHLQLQHNYILVSYTQSKLTLVTLDPVEDNVHRHKNKLAQRNPQICLIELENSSTRRVERKLVFNERGDLLIVWWKNGANSVAPWSAPGKSLRDLANILVYCFTKSHFELITCGCVSGDIFQVNV